MFAFKARSISEPIADPFTAGTTIPTNAVIFMTNNDMSTYASSSNWSFIDMGQSDGTPSQIRGCPIVSNVGLYQRNITDGFTTSTVGGHDGGTLNTYSTPSYNNHLGYAQRPYSAQNNLGAVGSHSHSVSGLSSSINLGGGYFRSLVVASYRCTETTNEIPKGAIVFANSVQNEDFAPITGFESSSLLISGSSTWLGGTAAMFYSTISTNYTGTFTLTPTISTSGDHNHTQTGQTGDELDKSYAGAVLSRTYYNNTYLNLGNPVHNHDANNMVATVSTKSIFLKAYRAVRNTSVYKGMILGWTGTNTANLPQGWYRCNGQIVNGFTTPVLNVDAAIRLSVSNNMGEINGTDTGTITYAIGGTQGQHSHYSQGLSYGPIDVNGTISNQHRDYPWNHRHDGTVDITFKQASYAINFIIYLG